MNFEYKVGDYIENRYRIMQIMRGGMGRVYISIDIALDQVVAIKTISEEFARGDLSRRFLSEAQTWILLEKHPHIVQAKTSFLVEAQPYIVVEYVDGGDLRGLLRNGAIDPQLALKLAIQYCSGAEYAYRKLRLVHRDIKPDNLLLTGKGILKIADFGLSRMGNQIQEKGFIAGTPLYMSPEQWMDGEAVTKQSDIYSFGIVLYEMLTGQHPFKAVGNVDSLLKSHMEYVPPSPNTLNPDISNDLSNVILKCLAKNPLHRFLHYEDLAEQLKEAYKIHAGETYTEPFDSGENGAQSPAELLNSGDSLFAIGEYSDALKYYDNLLDLDPHSAKFWRRKAETLARLSKFHEAELYFGKALSLEPSNLDAIVGNTKCLIKMSKYQEALGCCNPALEINPNNQELLKLKQKLLPAISEFGQDDSSNRGAEHSTLWPSELKPNTMAPFTVSFYNTVFPAAKAEMLRSTERDPNKTT